MDRKLLTMMITRETPIDAPCSMCAAAGPTFDGVFVSWMGEPRGVLALCLECVPKANLLLESLQALLSGRQPD